VRVARCVRLLYKNGMPPDQYASISERFFSSLGDQKQWLDAFQNLRGVCLFVKNAQHRFLSVNREELELHGLQHEYEMIGKDDFDFHPPALAAQYQEEDREVFASGKALTQRLWLVASAGGTPGWYLCSKYPLRDVAGNVIGLVGLMQLHDELRNAQGHTQRLAPVLKYVLEHYGEAVSVEQLAQEAHLSVSQLQREFRRLFGMSPTDYLLKVRLLMARRFLEQGHSQVGEIAQQCGFYDQSHFSRAFRTATGLRPLEYRKRFAPKV